jgi:pyridoxal phosphate enzyme (YggS family)
MYLERLQRAVPEVHDRMQRACQRVGRSDSKSIVLVAVTKGHPLDALCAARDVGLGVIGESRVQEAHAKREAAGDLGLRWHLVGHLQRNKVKVALPLFALVHSVDSLRLARAIDKEAEKIGERAAVLVQVNASAEESKYGFSIDAGFAALQEICELRNLRVLGLMTMAPFTDDEAVLRQTFRKTRSLYERCAEHIERFEAQHLSMGMTNDFEIAIEEGSTMVRLGTVLFGERGK